MSAAPSSFYGDLVESPAIQIYSFLPKTSDFSVFQFQAIMYWITADCYVVMCWFVDLCATKYRAAVHLFFAKLKKTVVPSIPGQTMVIADWLL